MKKLLTFIVLVGSILVVWFFAGNNKGTLTVYTSTEVGISLDYPQSWEDPEEIVTPDRTGFTFRTQIGPLWIGGVSDPYEAEGRGAGDIDIAPEHVTNACNASGTQDITTKEGAGGVYALGFISLYESCEAASSDTQYHYAALQDIPGLRNIVFSADPEVLSERAFLKIVESLRPVS